MRPEGAIGRMSDIRKRSDEQARQRLVEIALRAVEQTECEACRGQGYVERLYDGMITDYACEECRGLRLDPLCLPNIVRSRAGFKNPRAGHWCAAGLTAAMAQAGLLVPAPGTPARRGAIALLDWVARSPGLLVARPDADGIPMYFVDAQPGDIIAWLQHPPPDPAGWRRGHVAVIVATDSESITTVGWNEGPSPGRVMMRRLWRDPARKCDTCGGAACWTDAIDGLVKPCPTCNGSGHVPRTSTVLWRRPGGLYGIARPVAA